MVRVERFEVMPATPEELESTLQKLDEHVESVFNVEDAKAEFNELMRTLEEKRTKLKETVETLEKTKNTLKHEIAQRNEDEQKLLKMLEELNDEQESISASIKDDQAKLEKTRAEKEKISILMGSLKAAIEDMRKKLTEL